MGMSHCLGSETNPGRPDSERRDALRMLHSAHPGDPGEMRGEQPWLFYREKSSEPRRIPRSPSLERSFPCSRGAAVCRRGAGRHYSDRDPARRGAPMSVPRANRLLHHFCNLCAAPASCPATDADLLERFVRGRDEEAFTALLARHGPMVLRLCRRVLGEEHAAQDAFQATFLVLARKASSVRRPEALAAWLYGV